MIGGLWLRECFWEHPPRLSVLCGDSGSEAWREKTQEAGSVTSMADHGRLIMSLKQR